MKFSYICDPGHGWLRVPYPLILELKIQDQITGYSYFSHHKVDPSKPQFAYLQEDCDMPRFLQAYKAKVGKDPTIVTRNVKSTMIRDFNSFNITRNA